MVKQDLFFQTFTGTRLLTHRHNLWMLNAAIHNPCIFIHIRANNGVPLSKEGIGS